MRQIAKRLLPDTIKVYPKDTEADYDGKYLDPITIENVLWQGKAALNPRQFQLAENAKGRLWIDAVNSEGAFYFPPGSQVEIEINGELERMNVLVNEPFRITGGRLHHWEVDCG